MNTIEKKEKTQKEKEMITKLYWEIELKDKNGNLLLNKTVPAKSWLRQFIHILKGEFATRNNANVGNANVTVTTEAGVSRGYPRHSDTQYPSYWCNLSALGDAGDVTQGIIVGMGSTANDLSTYCLANKIQHGTGTNQLLYGAVTVEDVTNPSGTDLQFRITRAFTNNSGNSVSVSEIGLLLKKLNVAYTPAESYLAARDVLGSPVSVPDGASLTIRYIVRITVS